METEVLENSWGTENAGSIESIDKIEEVEETGNTKGNTPENESAKNLETPRPSLSGMGIILPDIVFMIMAVMQWSTLLQKMWSLSLSIGI